MNKYTVYFELFGHKMKTTVLAKNEQAAKDFVFNKIIFHKVEFVPENPNPIIDFFNKNIFK